METAYLMKKLEEAFPNKLPRGQISEYTLGELVGEQNIIYYLKSLLKLDKGELDVIIK
jgi:hypothetical protein